MYFRSKKPTVNKVKDKKRSVSEEEMTSKGDDEPVTVSKSNGEGNTIGNEAVNASEIVSNLEGEELEASKQEGAATLTDNEKTEHVTPAVDSVEVQANSELSKDDGDSSDIATHSENNVACSKDDELLEKDTEAADEGAAAGVVVSPVATPLSLTSSAVTIGRKRRVAAKSSISRPLPAPFPDAPLATPEDEGIERNEIPEKKKKSVSKAKSSNKVSRVTTTGKNVNKKTSDSSDAVEPRKKKTRANAPNEVWSGFPTEQTDFEWAPGWIKKTFKRQSGATKGTLDNYWYTPAKQYKLRSHNEVRKFLKALENNNGDEDKAWRAFKK